MTNPTPRWALARYETNTTVIIADTTLEPFNAGTVRNPRPSRAQECNIRTRDGDTYIVSLDGRRILKKDEKHGRATGARMYQSWTVQDHVLQPAWGETDPPAWLQDLYDAWRSNNLVDGRP